jgi:mono/diheme cytochrome c family protein
MRRLLAGFLLVISLPAAAQQPQKADPSVARGRYVVGIAGCNDCHTPNYAPSGGKVAESEWLTGDALGWRGPWGTTYAPNLRLYMPGLTEEQWVKKAKTLTTRPPMPWFNLHHMSEADLRAIYRYVRHLGPAGKPAPDYVPPDKTPAMPYVQFPA